MTYKIKSTEKTTGIAADQETKAMLYLMNERDDSNQMHWFVIDFFNDVTGVDANCHTTWDVQAKASKNIGAKQLGEFSVTLFKNFCSELTFNYFLLFVGGVGKTIRKDSTKEVFGFSDMNLRAQKSYIKGLEKAAKQSSYIEKEWLTDSNYQNFSNTITIVIYDKPKVEIMRSISNIKKDINEEKLVSIFNAIRDQQSALKNYSYEGKEIYAISDFIAYKKYISADQIQDLILSRLLNYNRESDVPDEFKAVINKYEYDLRATTIKSCKDDILRVIFNKSNKKNFWILFSKIRELIFENKDCSIDEIYNKIDKELLENVPPLNINSARLFISIIKEGIKNDN